MKVIFRFCRGFCLFLLFMLGVHPMLIAQAPESSETHNSSKQSTESGFELAFEQLVSAARNGFENIVTEETIKVSYRDYKKVSVQFPGANHARYRGDMADVDYSSPTKIIHQVFVNFYKSTQKGSSFQIYKDLANRLKTIAAHNTQWQLLETSSIRTEIQLNKSSLPLKVIAEYSPIPFAYAVELKFLIVQ